MSSIQPNQPWLEYIDQPEEDWSLMEMAFLVAGQLQPDDDLSQSRTELADILKAVQAKVKIADSEQEQVQTIKTYLFDELGFKANTKDYFHPDNSLMPRVLETRKGIPITLSLIYLEVLSQLGIKCNGINFPGHFLVGVWVSGHYQIHDAFRAGASLDKSDIKKMLSNDQISAQNDEELVDFLQPATKRQIIVRLLRNLKNIYIEQQKPEKSLLLIEMILSLNPASGEEIRDRGMVYHYLEYNEGALSDLNTYLKLEPQTNDRAIIEALIESLQDHSTRIH